MMRKLLISALFIVLASYSHAQSAYYKFDNDSKVIYEKLLYLQLDSADILIKQQKQSQPNNLIPLLLENYSDFLRLVLFEDEDLFEQIKDRKKIRLNKWETGPKDSPWHLSGQAQIKLQWAFSRVLFDEYFTAATEINSAYHILEENKQKYPDFLADNMGIAILHAMIGVVPQKYQWAMEMFGLYGSISQGISEMEIQLNQDSQHPFAVESLFYYTFIELNLQTDTARFSKVLSYYQKQAYSKYSLKSPLLHFSKAVLLLKMDNDQAIEHFKSANFYKDASHFYYSDFLMAQALLYKLEPEAIDYFNYYLSHYPGENYKKAALQKKAWSGFIHGDTALYLKAMSEIPGIGASVFDADKVAEKESDMVTDDWMPNLYLLRSRLQFDGHYYQGALDELTDIEVSAFNEQDRLEYHYRKARIYHEMKKIEAAKDEYALTLKKGHDSDRYFAAKAALKLGEIAEVEEDTKAAETYYEEVLDLNFNEYRKGLRAKAKAGLQRVKK